ncbi:hypothetical protein BM523_18390 [Alteromonas mediterranea]|uniref:Uncharacterized protein n=2 Tax=Alteromonas mediterranea TaxID=314275 RepID=S5AIQ8_9ALTE|nr:MULTISPECIES: hypothetical protein [Alteromonas]AGP79725.1 hypothetical protein I633_21155 [Alteromonas mediterranea 615]AGP95491.1 hypothetical protein I634_19075 [Alteromonas mediterranea U8]MBR9785473.1 hypothetical protein [Gammaproteobacteria bacterium]MDY6882594.1 hypothetical protein [Pseudomonadota bacterium]OUX86283.1 MAG: hypothetical protein CBB95_11470 [Alteromonas sp. TMED35]
MTPEQISNQEGFVSLNVKASVLQKMLSVEVLHMTDIHCTCAHSKRVLQKLLLQVAANGAES